MILEIESTAVEKILQRVVEEEVEFLARQLLANREVRFTLWCWLLQNFQEHGVKAAGITDPNVAKRLEDLFNTLGVPMPTGSGPGGGGDSGSREDAPSGGGSDEPPIRAGSCQDGIAPDKISGNSVQTAV